MNDYLLSNDLPRFKWSRETATAPTEDTDVLYFLHIFAPMSVI